MRMNPELQRNLWLEWSAHRCVFVVVVLASIFTLVSVFDPNGFGNTVANTALSIFVISSVVWGGHRAGEAMLEELRDRTWDSQRMSALGPWTMTWGKLCGATVMPWFAGFICLTVYIVARQRLSAGEMITVIAACIAGAVGVHALSLISALIGTRREKQARSTLASWAAAVTIALLAGYFSTYLRSSETISWYGIECKRGDFLVITIIALAAWVVFGAYRLMSMELAVATRPWAWAAFVLFICVHFAGGYIDPSWPLSRSLSLFCAIGLYVSVPASYIAAFALHRDPLSFRRLALLARARRWRHVLEETPIWIVSFALSLIFTSLCVVLSFAPQYSEEPIENVGFTGVVVALYVIRNLGLLYFFSYAEHHRRVETTTIIYIAIFTWLLPAILETSGLLYASWAFRPPAWDKPLLSIAIIAVHVVVVGALCLQRYRQRITPKL